MPSSVSPWVHTRGGKNDDKNCCHDKEHQINIAIEELEEGEEPGSKAKNISTPELNRTTSYSPHTHTSMHIIDIELNLVC